MSSLSPSDSSHLPLYYFQVVSNPGYTISVKNFNPPKYLMLFWTPDITKPSGRSRSVEAWPNAWEPVAYD